MPLPLGLDSDAGWPLSPKPSAPVPGGALTGAPEPSGVAGVGVIAGWSACALRSRWAPLGLAGVRSLPVLGTAPGAAKWVSRGASQASVSAYVTAPSTGSIALAAKVTSDVIISLPSSVIILHFLLGVEPRYSPGTAWSDSWLLPAARVVPWAWRVIVPRAPNGAPPLDRTICAHWRGGSPVAFARRSVLTAVAAASMR